MKWNISQKNWELNQIVSEHVGLLFPLWQKLKKKHIFIYQDPSCYQIKYDSKYDDDAIDM